MKTIILDGKEIVYSLQRKNVKNINLRIRNDGSIYVSANERVAIELIENFIRSNSGSILSSLSKIEQRQQMCADEISYQSGDTVNIFGKERLLKVIEGKRNFVQFENGTAEILLTVRDTENVELKRKTVEKWKKELCAELVTELCRRTYPIFEERGYSFPEIHFKNMRTRWGSCNAARPSLNFSYSLVTKPVRCVQYVVMHEFVHLIHQDHSKAFYETLGSLMPDWKERKKELNS